MSLHNSALLIGATVAATGGSATTFKVDGQKINGGIHLVETSPSDFRTADNINVVTKQSVYNSATSEYSKSQRSMKYVRPFISSSGKMVFRSIKIEIEDHPEISAADMLSFRQDAVQMAFDSEYVDFWNQGTLD